MTEADHERAALENACQMLETIRALEAQARRDQRTIEDLDTKIADMTVRLVCMRRDYDNLLDQRYPDGWTVIRVSEVNQILAAIGAVFGWLVARWIIP